MSVGKINLDKAGTGLLLFSSTTNKKKSAVNIIDNESLKDRMPPIY
jgi:hypothetical protein